MIKQVHNSLTIQDNLWTLKFDNFSEFYNVISDSPFLPPSRDNRFNDASSWEPFFY